MVERQLRRRGISDERVLAAMGAVPREAFVPEAERRRAYRDGALPIGHGQTISQPWIVAAIAQALALEGGERVLDVGSGSGYSAAVMARARRRGDRRSSGSTPLAGALARDPRRGSAVRALRSSPPTAARARRARALRRDRRGRDGARGAGGLLGQLAIGGRLVVPIASDRADMLTVFRRTGEAVDVATGAGLETASLGATRFVPLIGRAGFDERG